LIFRAAVFPALSVQNYYIFSIPPREKRKTLFYLLTSKKNPAQNPKKICAENEQILRRK